MMTDPELAARAGRRFDHEEIHPDAQAREGHAAVELANLEECRDRAPQPGALGPVERLLRQTEVAPAAPADLHEHELRGRAGIHRHDVQFPVARADVPAEDPPARSHEAFGNQLLGCVSEASGLGRHQAVGCVAMAPRWQGRLRAGYTGMAVRLYRALSGAVVEAVFGRLSHLFRLPRPDRLPERRLFDFRT